MPFFASSASRWVHAARSSGVPRRASRRRPTQRTISVCSTSRRSFISSLARRCARNGASPVPNVSAGMTDRVSAGRPR